MLTKGSREMRKERVDTGKGNGGIREERVDTGKGREGEG